MFPGMFSRFWIRTRFWLFLFLVSASLISPGSAWAQVESSRGYVDFGEVIIGQTVSTQIKITNFNDQDEELHIRLVDPHPGFWLSGTHGVVTVPSKQNIDVYVNFAPVDSIPYEGTMLIGEGVPEVGVVGMGRGLRLSYYVQPVKEFEQIAIGTTREYDLILNNTGDIPFEIHPQLLDQVPYFNLLSPLGPTIVSPLTYQAIRFQYAPEEVQQFEVLLDLGDVVHQVLLRGSSREPAASWYMTSYLFMGNIQPGDYLTKYIKITNNGDLPISGSSSFVGDHEGFEFHYQVQPFELEPGDYHQEYIRFAPAVEDTFTALVTFGEPYGTIPLRGICEILYPHCSVSPRTLDFENVALGNTGQLTVQVMNREDEPLYIDPAIDSPHFSISAVPRTLSLYDKAVYTVKYHPQTTGPHEARLVIAPDLCRDVVLIGVGGISDDHCQVMPDTLRFGPLSLGRNVSQLVSVHNIGNTDLILRPSFDSPAFSFAGGDANLTAGSSTVYSITFEPYEPGTTTAMFELGGICRPIVCQGTAVSGFEPHQNQVGIYFDRDFEQTELVTEQTPQDVTGYLVLHNPSEDSGVGAYELKVELTGPGTILDWELEGDAINVGSGNELIVGVGGSPLLPDANGNTLLATMQVRVNDPLQGEVSLQLDPIAQASLPGLMAWIPGHDPTMLTPLLPASGFETACWINHDPVSAVDIPAPLALVQGDHIILGWNAPDGFPEDGGFHVYRRVDLENELRLTDQPLSAAGRHLSYTDRISGYAPATVLRYSYALVENGAETLRSPETEIHFSSVPAMRTRLVANVPNPFNPNTEVRFELRIPGPTRVSVYGLDGRLVRDLVDEFLGAGTHYRVWNGRDSAGRPVPSGAYYLRLVTQDAIDHHKMMLLK